MKNIVVSWINSLKMLAPANLWPLLQVTFKTLLEVYVTVFKEFWWLVAFSFLDLGLEPMSHNGGEIVFWMCMCVLAARPSVELKDFKYFFIKYLYLLPIAALVWILLRWYTSLLVSCGVAPYVIFMLFFMLDANETLSEIVVAPWRALKMSVALLPIYVLLSLLLYGPLKLLLGMGLLGIVLWVLAVMPLFITFMSRLYIITIHKNYKEYYEHC